MHYFVQNAIDELRRLGGAEALGQFYGLVDGDTRGRVGVQQLVGPQPEHVAIGGRHPLEAPMGGNLLDQGVQLRPLPPHAGDQLAGERSQVVAAQAAVDELIAVGRVVTRIQIVLVEDLEGDFSCSAAAGHGEGI